MNKHFKYNHSEKGRARDRRFTESGGRRRANARRVRGLSGYLGYAPTTEGAEMLNNLRREHRVR